MTSSDRKLELMNMGFSYKGFYWTYPNSDIKISGFVPIITEDIDEWNDIVFDLKMKIRDLNIDKLTK